MQDTMVVLSRDVALAGLIARLLRCRRVYCAVLPLNASLQALEALSAKGVIVAQGGDPAEALQGLDPAVPASRLPILTLGAAAAALCAREGGSLGAIEAQKENSLLTLESDPLFTDIEGGERMIHFFSALTLPESLTPIARASEKVIGFRHTLLPHYGLQYPIERNDPDGAQLLTNFACEICGCRPLWDDDTIIDEALESIRAQLSDDGKVLCAVSGGVDSAVCAKLASLAVGNRLTCVLVDTGLFHQNEPETIIAEFMDAMGIVVAYVDARQAFLQALEGVTKEAEKERIASALMTRILLKQLTYEPDVHTLIMGTNFNDTLYGFTPTAEIDSLKGELQLTVLEPIKHLFKEEVRRLAQTLMLPAAFANRQPFPTGGLALRIFGEVTEERLQVVRSTDACLTEEILAGGYERKLWQYYTSLHQSPDKANYYTVCIRVLQANQSCATSARLPFDLLERITQRILTEVHSISRVVYDLTPSAHYGELE